MVEKALRPFLSNGYHDPRSDKMASPGIRYPGRIRIFLVNVARRILPRSTRLISLKFFYFLSDIIFRLLGLADKRLPWRSETVFVGRGDFKEIGQKFVRYFIELGGLQPHDKVLDIGCGIGRMAIPLTRYLDGRGLYEGFDIIESAIDWCQRNISSHYENFHFQWADVFNREYNSKGKFKASRYRFPWADEFFDFVFLTSVFTHMLPDDLENYLSEIRRVLKKGKKCFITYFLLNEESTTLMNFGKSQADFKYHHGKFRTLERDVWESAIAYEESFILHLYDKYRLGIDGIYYGSWCGRKRFLNYQDIVIASKKDS